MLRAQVVPVADVITPNQFELGFLTDTEPQTLEEVLDRRPTWRARWVRDDPGHQRAAPRPAGDTIETDRGRPTTAPGSSQTPRLPMKANGSGDVTSALFTAHLLRDRRSRPPSAAPSPRSSRCSTRPSLG